METNETGSSDAADRGGLIPAHFAKISIPQAHRAIYKLAQEGGVQKQIDQLGNNPFLDIVFFQGHKVIVMDCAMHCAWADPKVLS